MWQTWDGALEDMTWIVWRVSSALRPQIARMIVPRAASNAPGTRVVPQQSLAESRSGDTSTIIT